METEIAVATQITRIGDTFSIEIPEELLSQANLSAGAQWNGR